jgi:D-alanyl-D-alanine carboxypeptidase
MRRKLQLSACLIEPSRGGRYDSRAEAVDGSRIFQCGAVSEMTLVALNSRSVLGARAITTAKRRVATALWAATLFGLVLPLPAYAGGKPASLVIDANTGHVVSAYNADEPRFPASLTKMMTLYVVFDLIEQGRLSYQTRIKISDRAASTPPSKLGLEEGSDLALIDAIKALITRSANDIAVAIAEHIAGSEEKFAALMTQRARAIGMKASTFKNASGLPNSDQVTTARDMVTLGLRLHDDFPKHYVLFAMREFRYAGRSHPNHNTLLNSYEGTEGIKTGYTQASGFNVVSSVKRGSKHVMGVVFGGASASSRNQTMRTLLNLALFKSSPTKTRAPTVLVARGRPVMEPRPEATPEAKAETKTAVAWPAVVSPAAMPGVAAPTPDVKRSETVEMARVRPVLVAPRAPHQAPTATASAVASAVVPSTAEPVAPLDMKLPPIASAAVASPTVTKASAAVVARAVSPPAASVGVSAAVGRGNPPSSFQQQAASLASGQPAAFHLSGPVRNAVPAPGSGFDIQIGAYSSAAEAERQLAAARSKAGDLIGSATGIAQQATANGKPIWRARFGGFQSASAASVCSELRRRQIDCLVAKAE